MSIASLATRSKLIKYADLQKELRLEGIRELEDLIIEGTNCNVMRGKLDQKSSHFEVDWAMGRDIRKVKNRETYQNPGKFGQITLQSCLSISI